MVYNPYRSTSNSADTIKGLFMGNVIGLTSAMLNPASVSRWYLVSAGSKMAKASALGLIVLALILTILAGQHC